MKDYIEERAIRCSESAMDMPNYDESRFVYLGSMNLLLKEEAEDNLAVRILRRNF